MGVVKLEKLTNVRCTLNKCANGRSYIRMDDSSQIITLNITNTLRKRLYGPRYWIADNTVLNFTG